jgi:hypothetical protein
MSNVMSTRSVIVTFLTVAAVSLVIGIPAPAEDQGPATSGPRLGKWEFQGKDNTGLAWSGSLTIEKLDPDRFDSKKYHAFCILEMQSTGPSKRTKVVEKPCDWNPQTRTFKFGDTSPAVNVFSAILSDDGKALTQGKWTETQRTGQWSAKLPGR